MADAATSASLNPPLTTWTAGARDDGARLNLALAALWWVWLSGELSFEWSVSEQYGYGLFVPFLTAYLLWLRVADRPEPRPWGSDGPVFGLLALAALAQYPIAVIFTANADWRLLAWTETLIALGATWLLLARWGGWPWVRHFTPALLLFLFAVPWPSYLQIEIVDKLMTFVAAVTTTALNFLGHAAVQQGHIIQLPNNVYVSIEEACSGVRSVQSTIMAAWLAGEWWRHRALGRAGLLVLAAAMAVVLNLFRTFTLAWLAATQGSAAMEHWHDTAGYFVYFFSFAVVLTIAWLTRFPTEAPPSPSLAAVQPNWLPTRAVVALLVVLAGAWPASLAWYAWRAPDIADKPRWSLNLDTAVPGAKSQAPSPDLRQALFFDRGVQATWTDRKGHEWFLYNLLWDHARAAQLGGVHSTENCLPSAGWVMNSQGPDYLWQRGGVTLIFNTYVFDHGPRRLFVFYCQWDPAGYPYNEKTGRIRSDRLLDAWRGDRKEGKQLLELALDHSSSLEAATTAVGQFLDAAIVVQPPASAQ
jgi:exosortase